jgi:hypothetical protein
MPSPNLPTTLGLSEKNPEQIFSIVECHTTIDGTDSSAASNTVVPIPI